MLRGLFEPAVVVGDDADQGLSPRRPLAFGPDGSPDGVVASIRSSITLPGRPSMPVLPTLASRMGCQGERRLFATVQS